MRSSESTHIHSSTLRDKETLDKLKRYYDIGVKALEKSKAAGGVYARGVITELMQQTGEKRPTVQKCREFAKLYSTAQFAELCRLRTLDDRPIGWGHVTKLLTVPDPKTRKEFQARIADEGWTVRQLDDQIKKVVRRKRGPGGRKWKLPTSKREALRQIAKRTHEWLTWYEQLKAADDFSLEDLPQEVRTLVEKLESTNRELQGRVSKPRS